MSTHSCCCLGNTPKKVSDYFAHLRKADTSTPNVAAHEQRDENGRFLLPQPALSFLKIYNQFPINQMC